MSDYVSKQKQIEWLDERESDALGSISNYNLGMAKAFALVRRKLKYGAFDADKSEGTWKATAEVIGRENAQMNIEIQRLREALEQIIAAYEGEGTDIQVARKMVKIAREALSTTSEPTGAERAKAAIADRYQNALHGWHNPVDRAAGSYYNGYLNGVSDMLRLLDITIPGINEPEKEENA